MQYTDEHIAWLYVGENAIAQPVRLMYFQHALHIYQADHAAFVLKWPIYSIQSLPESNGRKCFQSNISKGFIEISYGHPVLTALEKDIQSNRKVVTRLWHQYKPVWAISGLVLGVLLLYMGVTKTLPWVGMRLISREYEVELGQKLFDAFLEQEEVNDSATYWLQSFAKELKLSPYYPVQTFVVASEEKNAFATPGGFIVVNSALLEELDDYTSLVALLGHEAAHVNQRHGLDNLLKSASSGLFLSLFIGDGGGISSALLQQADMLRQLSYSRTLERQADELGMKMMIQQKVDPRGMVRLLKTLQEEESAEPVSFLSTHPATEERIKNAELIIKNLGKVPSEEHQKLQFTWRQIKKHI